MACRYKLKLQQNLSLLPKYNLKNQTIQLGKLISKNVQSKMPRVYSNLTIASACPNICHRSCSMRRRKVYQLFKFRLTQGIHLQTVTDNSFADTSAHRVYAAIDSPYLRRPIRISHCANRVPSWTDKRLVACKS